MTTAVEEEREHPSPVLAPSWLTEQERDVLAELMDSAVAPQLIRAVHEEDARAVEELLAGLERQDLYALTVVLAAAVEVGP
jgi:hypothetical protein